MARIHITFTDNTEYDLHGRVMETNDTHCIIRGQHDQRGPIKIILPYNNVKLIEWEAPND